MQFDISREKIIEMASSVNSVCGTPDVYPEPIQIRLFGKYAAFFRPEFRVEKRTYDIPTYSALRNLLQSIYYHPGMDVVPVICGVKNPIRHEYIATNGVKEIRKISQTDHVQLLSQKDVQQCTCEYLTNVEYYVIAFITTRPKVMNPGDSAAKFHAIMKRRIEHGSYGRTPFFGSRECYVNFEPLDDAVWEDPGLITDSRDYGLVASGFDYSDDKKYVPLMQHIEMKNGLIDYTQNPFIRL